MIDSINSSVGESCFAFIHPVSQEKKNLSADNASFKHKILFTTENPSFSHKLPFLLENVDSHHTFCFTGVKQDSHITEQILCHTCACGSWEGRKQVHGCHHFWLSIFTLCQCWSFVCFNGETAFI